MIHLHKWEETGRFYKRVNKVCDHYFYFYKRMKCSHCGKEKTVYFGREEYLFIDESKMLAFLHSQGYQHYSMI